MLRVALHWGGLAVVLAASLWIAAHSELLQWRDPIYIAAGFAGVIGLGALLVQPLLAGGYMAGLRPLTARRVHRVLGICLVVAVVIHVAGLWITSPPDVVDALTFTSPTPFSAWGVIAMWGVFAAAGIANARRRLPAKAWRRAHLGLGVLIAVTTILHALLIEGTMGRMSKALLCLAVLLATTKLIYDRRMWFATKKPARDA